MIEFKCHRCGKVDERIERGLVYCARCVAKQKGVRKKYLENCRALHCCTHCGKTDYRTKGGNALCFDCARKEAERARERYHKKKKKTAQSGNSETV